MIRFINRKKELETLKEDWESSSNSFIVVYGRRRIGKTRLIKEFLKDKKGVKFTAEDTNKRIQIKEFKDILSNFLNDSFLKNQEILNWSDLFNYLKKVLNNNERYYIWIDEFSYLIKNDSSLASVLQKFIDDFLRESKIFFIVSGSLFGLMTEKILSYSSPLYGRRTRDILLKVIPPIHSTKFLNMGFEDKIKTILSVGGIPEYLIVSSNYKNFEDFINKEFFKKDGYFFREPFFLLSREFKEIRTYFSILNAIAYGNIKPTEISNFVGIRTREIYPYLDLLINYNFIKREIPFLGDKKRGIYLINDNFLDFWFNFVHKNREKIENENFKIDTQELNNFFGKRFEIFINKNLNLFFKGISESGKWWYKDKDLDFVIINKEKKEIILGETKWSKKVNPKLIIEGIKGKNIEFKTNLKKTYAIFAKSFSKKINNFNGNRVYCFDLKDIQKVFTE